MRQIHYLLLTTYLLFLVHPVLAQPALDAPDIYTEEDSFNFGLIEEGEKPDHKFIVGNRGNKDLAILSGSEPPAAAPRLSLALRQWHPDKPQRSN